MTTREENLLARLRRTLSPARFRHSLAVARWAEELATRHGVSPDRARRAGLLHDLAKEVPGRRLARHVALRRLRVPQLREILRRRLYGLLHAHVSADRAAASWGERDRAVLGAVARHTLGAPRLSVLETILFVADYSSPDRRYPGARAVRSLARRDLHAALRETARRKIGHILASGRYLHPAVVRLWNGLT